MVSHLLKFPFQGNALHLGCFSRMLMKIFEFQEEMVAFLYLSEKGVHFLTSKVDVPVIGPIGERYCCAVSDIM